MTIATKPFLFIEQRAEEIIAPALLDGLMQEKITGIVFKNFLSSAEVSLIQNKIKKLPIEKKTIINDGFHSYPVSFAQFTQLKKAGLMTVEEYTNLAESILTNQTEEIGLNITDKLIHFLERNELFEEISPIIEADSGNPLVPFNVRELFPGTGELIIHCENLFFDEFPDFFKWLRLMNIKDNKLSYFITIQKPDEGGELCCYDLNWSNVKMRASHTTLKDSMGNSIDITDENIKKQLIKPDEGDLLLFAGGNVWHRVLPVDGSKSRITIGGFIAETNTKGRYYIWS